MNHDPKGVEGAKKTPLHLDAFLDGEDLDPESGESHIAHVIASGNILLDAANHGTLVDDRPPRKPTITP